MMREKLASFMAGRNGNDQLNLFLYAVDAVLLIAGMFVRGQIGQILYAAFFVLLLVITIGAFITQHTNYRVGQTPSMGHFYLVVILDVILAAEWFLLPAHVTIILNFIGG